MSSKIRPLGKRILIERNAAEATKGGIFLPESSKEKPRRGKVLNVGPGSYDDLGKLQPLEVKVGDEVVFGAYAGVQVKSSDANDRELLVLNEDEVLAIVQS